MEKAESHASFLTVFVFGWLCERAGDTWKEIGSWCCQPGRKSSYLTLRAYVCVCVCAFKHTCTCVWSHPLSSQPNKCQGFLMNTCIKGVGRERENRRDGEEVTLTAPNRVRSESMWVMWLGRAASCPFPSITFVTIMRRSLIPWLQSSKRPLYTSYVTELHHKITAAGERDRTGTSQFFPQLKSICRR